MRKLITTVLGLVLIAAAVFAAKTLIDSKKQPKKFENKVVTAVFTQKVENTNTPISITTSGNLMAKNKVALYSEVQGVFEQSAREFKPGIFYSKGQTLLRLNSSEHVANLQAQKSNLYNQMVAIMPDLRLDYPEAFPKWEAYIRDFDIEKMTQPLPEPSSEKEKLFISGRNILTTYYNVKNSQVRLTKYNIKAPFSGILTEAVVTPGTLVRAGQKLGEFIDPSVYEMEVAVNVEYMELLKIGKSVHLHNLENTKSWTGKVIRVNGRIDQTSQTIKVYIQVRGKDLREGMYLEADLTAREEENTFEVNRKLLVDNSKLYIVQDSVLALIPINAVYFNEKTAIIKGLEDGTEIVSQPVPGAYSGMKVKVVK